MKNEVIIGKMLGYIEKVLKYTQGMDYGTFVKQEVIMEACIFNLSQLGELAGNMDSNARLMKVAGKVIRCGSMRESGLP